VGVLPDAWSVIGGLNASNNVCQAQVLRGDYLMVYGAQDGGVAHAMPDVAAFVQQDFGGIITAHWYDTVQHDIILLSFCCQFEVGWEKDG